jgi:hypothetical protein
MKMLVNKHNTYIIDYAAYAKNAVRFSPNL